MHRRPPSPSARLFALVLLVPLAACKPAADASGPAAGKADAKGGGSASLTVTLATPQSRVLPQAITASGVVAPWEEAVIGSELGGVRVASVAVEVGDRVRKGDPLVRLDARALEVELRQAQAALAEAQAGLTLATGNADRARELVRQNFLSAQGAQQAIVAEQQAQARVQTAQSQLDAARLRLDYATVRAPDGGVISRRVVQPGQQAQAGAEMLRLVRGDRLEWRAELAEADLLRVRAGQRVVVTSSQGDSSDGKVRTIAPGLDAANRTAVAYVDLPQPRGLRAGMVAQGRIVLGESSALVVPRAAVVVRDGHSHVFVLADADRVVQRRIETGRADGDVFEVRSGLAPADRIVTAGAGFLADGDRVRVAPAEAATAAPAASAPATPPAAPAGAARR